MPCISMKYDISRSDGTRKFGSIGTLGYCGWCAGTCHNPSTRRAPPCLAPLGRAVHPHTDHWFYLARRIDRLYTEEGLIVRTQRRRQRASDGVFHQDRLRAQPEAEHGFRCLAFGGRSIRVPTGQRYYTRECLLLHADIALGGERVRSIWRSIRS